MNPALASHFHSVGLRPSNYGANGTAGSVSANPPRRLRCRLTIDATMFRVQQKHGLPSALLHRLRYRTRKDIWAGEFLHIKAVFEQRGLAASPVHSLASHGRSAAGETAQTDGEA